MNERNIFVEVGTILYGTRRFSFVLPRVDPSIARLRALYAKHTKQLCLIGRWQAEVQHVPRDAQGTAPGCAQRDTAVFCYFVILIYNFYFDILQILVKLPVKWSPHWSLQRRRARMGRSQARTSLTVGTFRSMKAGSVFCIWMSIRRSIDRSALESCFIAPC